MVESMNETLKKLVFPKNVSRTISFRVMNGRKFDIAKLQKFVASKIN